jgi:hypothetical protein
VDDNAALVEGGGEQFEAAGVVVEDYDGEVHKSRVQGAGCRVQTEPVAGSL